MPASTHYLQMVVHNPKVKNELTFPFVDTLLYIFILFGLFFPNFKTYTYSKYNLESLVYNFTTYIHHKLVKFNDSKPTINKQRKALNIATMC